MFNEKMLMRLVGFFFSSQFKNVFRFKLIFNEALALCLFSPLLPLFLAVGAFVAAQETRGLYREQGARCEQRPAALKRRSPVQTPARRPTPARLCQATPQPAGSDLQLQHLSRISSSATTLRSQQVRVVEGGVLVVVLVLAGAHGRGLARDLKRRLGALFC